MAEFFFFTEPSKLELQADIPSTTPGGSPDPAKAFGGIDANSFRLQNLFTATSSPKAIAVCDGTILVQAVDNPGGAITHVNIVLKPSSQPKLDLPKITYFIYKGVKISSLKSGSNLVSLGTNDLADKVWETHNAHKLKNPLLGANPDADSYLGLVYSASSSNAFYQKADTVTLDEIFYNNKQALLSISAGDHIGDFDEASFGLMTIVEKLNYSPILKLARSIDSILDVSSLGNENEHDENKFKFKLKREEVLSFLDDGVIWGAFHKISRGLSVNYGETTVESDNLSITGNAVAAAALTNYIWQNVLSKYKNHDCLYLDIRNEHIASYNFYDNYGDTFHLIQGTIDPLNVVTNNSIEVSSVNSAWPLFVLKGSLFSSTNVSYSDFKIKLTTTELVSPLVYIPYGRSGISTEVMSMLVDVSFDNGVVETIQKFSLNNNYHNSNWIPSYTRIVTSEGLRETPTGKSLKKISFLDNIFPVSEMEIPFTEITGLDSVDFVYYDNLFLVQNRKTTEEEYKSSYSTLRMGLAKDNGVYTFLLMPEKVKIATWDKDEKYKPIAMSTMRKTVSSTFIDLLIDNLSAEEVIKKGVLGKLNYYDFAEAENGDSGKKSGATAMLEGHYDFKNIHLLILSSSELSTIKTNITTNYPNVIKSYFTFKLIKKYEENSESTKVELVVRGLYAKPDHTVDKFELDTGLIMIAKDIIFNN